MGSRVVFNHTPAVGEGELKLSSRYWSLSFGIKVLMAKWLNLIRAPCICFMVTRFLESPFIFNSKIAAQSELRFGSGVFFFLLETAIGREGKQASTNNDEDDDDDDEGGGEVDRRRERRERHTTMAGLVNEREYGEHPSPPSLSPSPQPPPPEKRFHPPPTRQDWC